MDLPVCSSRGGQHSGHGHSLMCVPGSRQEFSGLDCVLHGNMLACLISSSCDAQLVHCSSPADKLVSQLIQVHQRHLAEGGGGRCVASGSAGDGCTCRLPTFLPLQAFRHGPWPGLHTWQACDGTVHALWGSIVGTRHWSQIYACYIGHTKFKPACKHSLSQSTI